MQRCELGGVATCSQYFDLLAKQTPTHEALASGSGLVETILRQPVQDDIVGDDSNRSAIFVARCAGGLKHRVKRLLRR